MVWTLLHTTRPIAPVLVLRTVLDAESVKQCTFVEPSTYIALSPTTRSDVIDCPYSVPGGGVWLDGSTLLVGGLDWITAYADYPVYGFRIRGRHKIASWFLFVPKAGNPILRQWLHTLKSILDTVPHSSHVAYSSPRTKNGHYFVIYQAFCHLVYTDCAFLQSPPSLVLASSSGEAYKTASPAIPVPTISNFVVVVVVLAVRCVAHKNPYRNSRQQQKLCLNLLPIISYAATR